METILNQHWHHLSAEQAIDLLGSDPVRGLALFEIKRRRDHFGPNTLSQQKATSLWVIFFRQFGQPLVYLLLAAGVATGFLEKFVDAIVIVAVVVINAVIGTVQEAKAAKAMDALKRLVTTETTVRRDGEILRLSSSELVPGDIVYLQSGDKIPADLRLIEAKDLRVDESALTGETVPVEKQTGSLPSAAILADRTNLVFTGTLVTYGKGVGVVVATGNLTATGDIARMVGETKQRETGLTLKIKNLSVRLMWVVAGLSLTTFVMGLIRHSSPLEMFLAVVALAVGLIPEGLPAAVTITLAIAVHRMAQRKAVIRRLPAVETLGGTTVICSDKTGTFTQNKMMVRHAWVGGASFDFSGTGYDPGGDVIVDEKTIAPPEGLVACLRCGVLCNDASLNNREGSWTIQGDPTEAALLPAARKAGLNETDLHGQFPRQDVVPFESDRQFMATLHRSNDHFIICLKGAVEKVLDRCGSAIDLKGKTIPLDGEAVHQQAELWAAQGFRILAFAEKRGSAKDNFDETHLTGLTFLGLQALMDPPRPEATVAVRKCLAAGIRVVMITGDHAVTARSIAGQLGLGGGSPQVMTGAELAELTDHALLDVVEKVTVFARMDPSQKLRVVQALQHQGHVVAMTGDGVNDAPALKRADIGVAMGQTGTDVARDAADMLLLDDNFATLEAAVEEGRTVFDNLSKFITWTLPTNLGAGLLLIVAITFALPLPLLPVQALWINMTTSVCLGLMLAFEPAEPGIMEQPPRDPRKPLLDGPIMVRTGIMSLLMGGSGFFVFEWCQAYGLGLDVARTAVVNLVVVCQIFYLFNCRSLTKPAWSVGLTRNRWTVGGTILMIGLQLLFSQLKFMNNVFHTAPLPSHVAGLVLALGLATFGCMEIEKYFWSRKSTPTIAP
jgi:cation-transporting ATPase F